MDKGTRLYSRLARLYQSALASARQQHRGLDLSGVRVCTVDGYQGTERAIMFFDMVVTDRIGFVKNANRLCVALSRAQVNLYVLASDGAMRQGLAKRRKNKDPCTLARLLTYVQKKSWVTRVASLSQTGDYSVSAYVDILNQENLEIPGMAIGWDDIEMMDSTKMPRQGRWPWPNPMIRVSLLRLTADSGLTSRCRCIRSEGGHRSGAFARAVRDARTLTRLAWRLRLTDPEVDDIVERDEQLYSGSTTDNGHETGIVKPRVLRRVVLLSFSPTLERFVDRVSDEDNRTDTLRDHMALNERFVKLNTKNLLWM
ncbi:uncharacterized protein BO97DRAFT_419547 [Aspergillus homomorphus CBS 101889]|uniref:DNA2/NAM7 helicase-like C-terminal domain-containing protein n=1 Tax=Aspergillus homomorphus (strain CBS 101889) TaxID=1450537 RepID=A0A395IDS1_ASPHC|nr:hypothetical protein BO97DRAFT_419547 [Aspergillus homomorphus CBS 101889]RAL17303.1 hypothetical protein BO97DRAFT_419547 [Aspergillus homomorphus CBS 101889]